MNKITINGDQLRSLVAKTLGIDPREVSLASVSAAGETLMQSSVQMTVHCSPKQGSKLLKLVDTESKAAEPG